MGKFLRHPPIVAGQKFGRLVVEEKIVAEDKKSSCYRCLCDCGHETMSTAQNLRSGRAKSCGCYRRDKLIRHGATRCGKISAEYTAWSRAKARCNDPKHRDYRHYGGRGIKVCPEWDRPNGFDGFRAYIGIKPFAKATLSRIDNNGDYEPGNVRWDTQTFQMNNTRSNHIVEYGSFRGTLSQAAKIFNIGYSTLRARLRRGMSVKEALTMPPILKSSPVLSRHKSGSGE